ncbi:MAG: autophagy protein [Chrysothrix sp. TS-e1954]|nr:MAG: autophagy protein [Chrysothrix sp. TS-e1954]
MAMRFVTFNQDHSLLAVGTANGFRLYNTDPFTQCYETHEGDVSLLEMLFSTSLVALVFSPRRLVITNTKRNSTICELTFPTTVLAVRLNRKRLVVVLEHQIYLYDISNMDQIQVINTSPNPHGICALSPSSERCYLAYPLPQRAAPSSFQPPSHVPPTSPHLSVTNGHVLIYDAISMQAVNVIEAHRAPLSCIAMNNDGTRLATASDKGTIIRVFSVPDAVKLFQFRRGSMPARIFSMAFNMTSTLLCVSSATETVHIFKLSTAPEDARGFTGRRASQGGQSDRGRSPSSEEQQDDTSKTEAPDSPTSPPSASDGSFAGMFRRTSQNVSKTLAATVGGYLPTAVSEMLEPARDFAWFKLPRLNGSTSSSNPLKSVVALSSNSPQVMAVTSEGNFLVFSLDLEKGGEGTLTKQHSVLDVNEKRGRGMLDD